MTTRNANAPTTMIDEKMARNVINAWYLYVYFILVMDSLVAMSVMKKTSCCWHDSARKRERERENLAQNLAMETFVNTTMKKRQDEHCTVATYKYQQPMASPCQW